MPKAVCSSIKESLLAYLGNLTEVMSDGPDCVITVPINTVDNRWIDVSIEEKTEDFFLVHDSGKSADELFLQGLPLSDSRMSILQQIGSRYGVSVDDGRFVVGCERDHLQHSIWAVAQCSSLAMIELLRHRPYVEEDSVKNSVGSIVTSWSKKNGYRVEADVRLKGHITQHTFDFVTTNSDASVAISILNPTAGSLARAERYGYQELDLKQSESEHWKKLAIIANPQVWSEEARRIVSKLATQIVDFATPNQSRESLTAALEELIAA